MREHVGSAIYSFVKSLSGPERVGKITGMLIGTVGHQGIKGYLNDYNLFVQKVFEAVNLINDYERKFD